MTNSKKALFVIAVLAIITIIVISFDKYRSPRADSNQSKIIRVGVILPLSGQYSSIGESDRNAIIMARDSQLDSLNQNKNGLEFFYEDDKYDAKTAVSAYHKLRGIDGIDAVIVLSAPSIQAIKPLTDADQIPLFGLGATNVYEDDSVFQLMPAGNMIFSSLGKIYGDKYKNITVVHSSATLFDGNAKNFIKGLPSDVKYTDIILNPATDYRTEVEKIIQLNPAATTVFLPKDDAIKFLKSLKVQDRQGKIKIVCDFGAEIAVTEYTEAIGSDRLEGCISINLGETASSKFKSQYKERFGSDPLITADYAYDSIGMINALVESMDKIATKELSDNEGIGAQWIKILANDNYSYFGEASGQIKFNSDGTRLDITPTVHVYKQGKFESVSVSVP